MRRKALVGILFICAVILFLVGTIGICAAQPTVEWLKIYGGAGRDIGTSVQQTSDGGYITGGIGGARHVWLIKTDFKGNEEWNKTFGEGLFCSVRQTLDGGYIILDLASEQEGTLLIKTDSSGGIEWYKTFKTLGFSVQQTSDSGYIMTGLGVYGDDIGILLMKTDSKGNKKWNKTIGGGLSSSVQQTSDGGYIITGSETSETSETFGDILLIKTDSKGNIKWSKTFRELRVNIGCSVQQTFDKGYIIGGYTGERCNILLIKTDSNGNKEWSKTFREPGTWGIMKEVSSCFWQDSVQQTFDGGFIIVSLNTTNSSDILLIKTDSNGNEEWSKKFGEGYYDIGYSVKQTTDGGYIITGGTKSYGAGGWGDVILIKLAPETPIIPTPISSPTLIPALTPTITPTPTTLHPTNGPLNFLDYKKESGNAIMSVENPGPHYVYIPAYLENDEPNIQITGVIPEEGADIETYLETTDSLAKTLIGVKDVYGEAKPFTVLIQIAISPPTSIEGVATTVGPMVYAYTTGIDSIELVLDAFGELLTWDKKAATEFFTKCFVFCENPQKTPLISKYYTIPYPQRCSCLCTNRDFSAYGDYREKYDLPKDKSIPCFILAPKTALVIKIPYIEEENINEKEISLKIKEYQALETETHYGEDESEKMQMTLCHIYGSIIEHYGTQFDYYSFYAGPEDILLGKGIPGFEAVFSIAGLLVVAFILRRKK